jgi:hypothetical protein
MQRAGEAEDELYVPTLTDVFPSSSEARLPPPTLLVILIRLVVRGGRIIALMGREPTPGEPGGELAMALCVSAAATKCYVVVRRIGTWWSPPSIRR